MEDDIKILGQILDSEFLAYLKYSISTYYFLNKIEFIETNNRICFLKDDGYVRPKTVKKSLIEFGDSFELPNKLLDFCHGDFEAIKNLLNNEILQLAENIGKRIVDHLFDEIYGCCKIAANKKFMKFALQRLTDKDWERIKFYHIPNIEYCFIKYKEGLVCNVSWAGNFLIKNDVKKVIKQKFVQNG